MIAATVCVIVSNNLAGYSVNPVCWRGSRIAGSQFYISWRLKIVWYNCHQMREQSTRKDYNGKFTRPKPISAKKAKTILPKRV